MFLHLMCQQRVFFMADLNVNMLHLNLSMFCLFSALRGPYYAFASFLDLFIILFLDSHFVSDEKRTLPHLNLIPIRCYCNSN